MTRTRLITVAVGLILVLGVGVLIWSRSRGGGADAADVTPTASVTVAAVERRALRSTASVYGVIQAGPAGSVTLAAPRAVIVRRVLVRPGATVSAGQPLIELADAPVAALAYAQAVNALKAAGNDLARVQRLYDQHLAASDQLIAAQKAAADAEAAVTAQTRQGAGQMRQTLRAPAAAIVTSIPVAVGDHTAQDGPLIVLAREGGLVAKLGLEPSAGHFQAGQPVTLRAVAGGPAIGSRLTMVGRAADPATKTIDAIAPLERTVIPLGAAVQGEVVTGTSEGLTVPRASVVFDETGSHVFVVAGGKARRVFVTAGADHGDQLAVTGGLKAGDQVAVQGAYELQDGMAVKVSGR